VGYKDGEYLLNPSYSHLLESSLSMVVAGTDEAVLMVESEAQELTEDEMLGAVLFAHQEMQVAINAIKELAAGEPRIDGRDTRTVRPIDIRTGVLPRPTVRPCSPAARPRRWCHHARHRRDAQIIDALEGSTRTTSCCTTTSRRTASARPA
jgi:hypothetical protein